MSEEEKSDRAAWNHSLTLHRGLLALRVLAEHPDGLSVSELAAALDTHRAGTYRLLGPLIEQRLVHRTDGGRHVLGAGLVELASRVQPRLQEVAVLHLRELADELGTTTALTLRDEDEAVVAAVVQPRNTDVHVTYRAGVRHLIDQAASGIAILAGNPPQPGERAAITEARARGWSVSRSELLKGLTGVGAPIRSGPASEASISAVWIEPRDSEAAGKRLAAVADQISAELRS
ncbi:MAG TPA: helix-turn-helix domain-containing protein [Baekduia sp.]|nr:helix-turn-helix domain-containing protein [Baekduia sp.]